MYRKRDFVRPDRAELKSSDVVEDLHLRAAENVRHKKIRLTFVSPKIGLR